jgi:hypothetical protein
LQQRQATKHQARPRIASSDGVIDRSIAGRAQPRSGWSPNVVGWCVLVSKMASRSSPARQGGRGDILFLPLPLPRLSPAVILLTTTDGVFPGALRATELVVVEWILGNGQMNTYSVSVARISSWIKELRFPPFTAVVASEPPPPPRLPKVAASFFVLCHCFRWCGSASSSGRLFGCLISCKPPLMSLHSRIEGMRAPFLLGGNIKISICRSVGTQHTHTHITPHTRPRNQTVGLSEIGGYRPLTPPPTDTPHPLIDLPKRTHSHPYTHAAGRIRKAGEGGGAADAPSDSTRSSIAAAAFAVRTTGRGGARSPSPYPTPPNNNNQKVVGHRHRQRA